LFLPVLPVALADCSVDVASAAGADLKDFKTIFIIIKLKEKKPKIFPNKFYYKKL
jgi:hypothetical protein